MRIDRKRFFGAYRKKFGPLAQRQVDGLVTLLAFIESDTVLSDVRHFAYLLAAIKHECADRWHPIEEIGKGRGRKYGNPSPVTGLVYYGRGYTQTTWEENYRKLSVAWTRLNPDEPLDFVYHPELLLEPRYSYFATSYALAVGLYTGKKLSDYLNERKTDYLNARRTVNGTDKATLIAGYAEAFEEILRSSLAPDHVDEGPVETAIVDDKPPAQIDAPKEGFMKGFFQSKTMWGLILAGLGLLLEKADINITTEQLQSAVELLLQVGGGLLAFIGRLKAGGISGFWKNKDPDQLQGLR